MAASHPLATRFARSRWTQFGQRLLPLLALAGASAGLMSCASDVSTSSYLKSSSSGIASNSATRSTPRSTARRQQPADTLRVAAVTSTTANTGDASSWNARVRQNLAGARDKHGFPSYRSGAKHMRVRTTAYTHTEADHLVYSNRTAIGSQLRAGKVRSCAADWSVYPLGTTFRIRGLPYVFVVDDYGSALVGTNTIDLYTPNDAVMNQWGVRTVDIEVVRWGSFARSQEVLADRRGYSHCRQMYDTISRRGARG